ncbi:MAG: glutamate-1-semialdehyde 2,1-aminomutase [Planctomycetota bacterium]|nr:glutamate-1-semialdehyde 2,1-aminomutase [Planctomycetota bacterium]
MAVRSYQKSSDAFSRAIGVIPGGVNSPARAFGAVGGTPIFVDHARGAYIFDLDGHRYIDYIGSWGPMILGHAHPKVLSAVQAAAEKGTSFGAPTEAETEIAERIIAAVPSIEKVRFVNSGTEATMSAIRLARGYTGRDKIIKFAGNYHGHADSLLVAAGSSAATLSVPNSPGVTSGAAGDTIILPYNDPEKIRSVFAGSGSEIAAVILEPVVGNMGCVIPENEFLQTLREETQNSGAVLIYDEVMTGFRVAFGGAQSLQGIIPDLTTLGKIVGGGLPAAAYGGRAEIMDHILPAGDVFQAGTLSGNPLATAAGNAILRELADPVVYEKLDMLGAQLHEGLDRAAEKIPHSIARVGSMLTLFFNPEPVTNWAQAERCDTNQFARYFHGMLQRGVYLPCSQYEAMFISNAHTSDDIEETIAAAEEVFSDWD